MNARQKKKQFKKKYGEYSKNSFEQNVIKKKREYYDNVHAEFARHFNELVNDGSILVYH